MLSKPSWLSGETYRELVACQAQVCRVCGTTADLTVDHVVARANGGTDDLSNLAILCVSHNSQKGVKPDPRFDRDLYFDNQINLDALRAAQRTACWDVVQDHYAWFTRPWSQINRRLYTIAAVVGAGKTLALPVVPFALNNVILRELGRAHPRTERLLILAKEQAIRDQIAYDIPRDLVRYGIVSYAPTVGVVNNDWLLDNPLALQQYDIVVACVQQFWEKNGRPRDNLEQILSHFQVIGGDEPHFAASQFQRIVEAASTSLVFGTTGSPINASGDALKPYVLFSLYGYRDAVDNDKSLKWLDDDPTHLAEIIEEIDIHAASVQHGPTVSEIKATSETSDYAIQAVPMKNVADRVVQYVVDCDAMIRAGDAASYKPAFHRLYDDVFVTLEYPVHGLIVADSIESGRAMQRYLQQKFEANREQYPLARGYNAIIVYGDQFNEIGATKVARLNDEHPWKRFQKIGTLDAECARILIAIGIGREGVNNQYCGVVGVACRNESIVESVQRTIGRQLRAVVARDDDGRLHVPPDRLDTPKIILHRAFGGRATLERAIRFVLRMDEHLEAMVTLDQLIEGNEAGTTFDVPSRDALTGRDRIAIGCGVGRATLEQRPYDPAIEIEGWHDWSPRRQETALEWINEIQRPERRKEVQKVAGIVGDIRARSVVNHEWVTTEPGSYRDIDRFINIHHPGLRDTLDAYLVNDGMRRVLDALYGEHVKRFHVGEILQTTDVNRIRLDLAQRVRELVGNHLVGEKEDVNGALYAAIGIAVKKVLGADGSVRNGGEYDTPKHHAILRRPEIQREMTGFVLGWLGKKGYCPSLAMAFGLDEEGGYVASEAI